MLSIDHLPFRLGRRLQPLRTRREAQVLLAYGGGAWLVYDILDLVTFALGMPDVILRALLGLLTLGAVVAVAVARWYGRTVRWVEAWRGSPEGDVPGVPDVLEPLLIRASGVVRGRTAALVAGGSSVTFALMFLGLGSWWAEAHAREVEDPRVGVAVFPLAAAGPGAEGLGAALADLLVVTLDGTRGLRVVDPAALWTDLPGGGDDAPPLDAALERARAADARWVVRGSVTGSGTRLEATLRIHETDAGALAASIRGGAVADSLGALVDRLAIETVTRIWDRGQLPTVPEIDRLATADPGALKAWLDAKALARQGRMDAALEAVEEAAARDPTFALAHLDHYRVLGWVQFQNAQLFSGLTDVIGRAAAHADRLSPRNRMRVDAALAQNRSEGQRAAFLLERILAIDPRDVDALESLAHTFLIHGWQIGKGPEEVRRAYRDVLEVDPTSLMARAGLARLDAWEGRLEEALRHADSIPAADSASAYARGTVGAVRALGDADPAPRLRALARAEIPVVSTVLRDLRSARPALAERFLLELHEDDVPLFHRRVGEGALAQLRVGESRISAVDSVLGTGVLDGVRPVIEQMLVASALAGTSDAARARRAAAFLASRLDPDSLAAHVAAGRPAWSPAWALGAYHAALGDTAEARRWQAAIAGLPRDLFPWDLFGALEADLESRLAERAGRDALALELAQEAAARWTVPSFNVFESEPDPALRFRVAELHRRAGRPDRAEPWYRGLAPPHTWSGFYTAASDLRLGEILEARGALSEAHRRYRAAAALWERGDPERVAPLLEQARGGALRTGGG